MADISLIADYSSLKQANQQILAVGTNAQKSARVYEQAFRKVEQEQRKSLSRVKQEIALAQRLERQKQKEAAQVKQQIAFSQRLERQKEREAAAAQRASQKAAQAAQKVAAEEERLRIKFVEGHMAMTVYSREMDDLARARKMGIISTEQQTQAVARLNQQMQAGTGLFSQGALAAANLNNAQRMAGKGTNRFGMVAQQVGYQVGDFFVQVQSGTNAILAFGQQATQLAGLLPSVTGAVLGIGIALGSMLVGNFMRARQAAKEASEGVDTFAQRLSAAQDEIREMREALELLASGFETMMEKTLADRIEQAKRDLETATEAFEDTLRAIEAARLAGGGATAGYLNLFGFGTGAGDLETAREAVMLAEIELATAQELLRQKQQQERNESVINQLHEARKILQDQLKANQEELGRGLEGVVTVWESIRSKLSEAVIEAAKFAAVINNLNRTNLQGSLEYSGRGGDPRDFMSGPTYSSEMGYKSAADLIAEATGSISTVRGSSGGGGGIVDQAAQTRQVLDNLLSDLGVQQTIEEIERAREASERLGKTMKDSLGNALMSVVDGTKSAADAFKDMARQILKQAYDLLVIQPLMNSMFGSGGTGGGLGGFVKGLFAADGAAFNGSGVQMFADGGVVNSPTGFRHSGGLGVMGEAGPEAIMPLKRGRNGKLGVQMDGGQQPIVINQSFNFSANGDESVKRIIAQEAPKIASYTQKQIIDQRRRGGAMKSTFG